MICSAVAVQRPPEDGAWGDSPEVYFLPFTACFAAAALFFFCVLELALACFCEAFLFVAFGDLSPIRRTAITAARVIGEQKRRQPFRLTQNTASRLIQSEDRQPGWTDNSPVVGFTSMLAHSSSVSAKRKVNRTSLSSATELLSFNPCRLSFRSSNSVTIWRNCSGLRPPPDSHRDISCNSPLISLQIASQSIVESLKGEPLIR